MEDFVRAKLVSNRPGATYQGHTWDRFLTLELSSGDRLEVFDPHCISSELTLHDEYEFILSVLVPGHVTRCDAVGGPPSLQTAVIAAVDWRPPKDRKFECVYPGFLEDEGRLLVHTEAGNMVMYSSKRFPVVEDPAPGMRIAWDYARFDLEAAAKVHSTQG